MNLTASLRARSAEWNQRWNWTGGALAVTMLGWAATAGPFVPIAALGFVIYLLASIYYPELNLLLYYIPGKIGFEERLELQWGISANQVFQVLFGVALLLELSRRRARPFFPRVTVGVVGALSALLLAGLLRADNVPYGAFKALSYAFLVLPGVAFLGLQVEHPLLLRRFLLFFFAMALAMMLLGLRNIGSLEQGHRLAVFGGGANVYSRIVGCGLLLLVTFTTMLHRAGWRRLAWLVAALLAPGFLVAMYYAGSKGPMLGLFMSFLLFAALQGFLRRTVWIALLMTGAFFLARQHSGSFNDTIELVSVSRLFLNPSAEISYGSYGSRLDFYKYSAERFAESPVVGIGTGGWGSRRKLFDERSYPHNLFIELACELGLVGVLLVGGFCLWLVREAHVLLRRTFGCDEYIIATGLVTCTLFWLINVQVSGDVVDNRNLWLFAALTESGARISRRTGNEGTTC